MELVMQRRQIELSQTDKDIIKKVFSLSEKYRKF
jgi:hypothetical protein